MNRAYKFKLSPNKEQEEQLIQIVGCIRFVWNKMLEANINQYKIDKKFIWSKTYQLELPKLKKENDWLKLPPSQSLQQKCDDLEKALKMTSSKRSKQFGFPKFKSKNDTNQSFRIPYQNNNFKFEDKFISIPKLGDIKWIRHREINGSVKNITIKKENNIWFVVVCCELPNKNEMPFNKEESIGIDLGLTDFAVLSDGTKISTPKFYRNAEKKLKKEQRKLSRKKKNSNNYKKQKRKLNKIHRKIKNQRHNFIHQTSSSIAKKYLGVFVEDLNIDQIKKRFGKSTSDQGWNMFINALAYKCNHLSKIGRYMPSTKTCSSCGTIHQLSLSDRIRPCCGIDRDLNAAINIHNWGYQKYTDGMSGCASGCDFDENIAIDISNHAHMKEEKFFNKKPIDL